MEIRRWLCYIIIKCVFIQYLFGKSVSLNEIIAAESEINQVTERPSKLRLSDSRSRPIPLNENIAAQEKPLIKHLRFRKFKGIPKRFSLSKRLASYGNLRKINSGALISGVKNISPLTYRKTFQIKSPLKPKKLKLALKSRNKRKNQSTKREINGNEGLKHKYIPLLKSLSMLFDNLLNSDESDSYEAKRKSYKRNRFYSEELLETPSKSSSISNSRVTSSRSQKKTTTPPTSFSTEISSDTESITLYKNYDYGSSGSDQDLPILLPRNTVSRRRNNNGPSKRSSATHHRNIERDITRDNRNHEYNTRCAENESCAQSNKNDTNSVARNDTGGVGHSGTNRNRNNTRNSENRKTDAANHTSKDKDTDDTVGTFQFENRRNKTESEELLREPVRGLRGYISKITPHEERFLSELVRPKEIRQKSVLNATNCSTGHKRITNENGPFTTKDEKVRTGNETVIVIERNSRHTSNYSESTDKKGPVVLIFDGYSVTRNKNGENKVSGKTIHIRS